MIIEYKKISSKNSNKRKEDTIEHVYYVDRISDKIIINSHTIIDIINNTCTKTRFENVSNNKIVSHFLKKYKVHVEITKAKYFKKHGEKNE